MIHFYKTPDLAKGVFNSLVWDIKTDNKDIYLTFDDGPIPKLTSSVLNVLRDYEALATFFCVGENIFKFPSICEEVLSNDHLIGNHTYNHLKGWTTQTVPFLENIALCERQISSYQTKQGKSLFRPPHGQITFDQIRSLNMEYNIVMWDVLAYDFKQSHSPEKSLDKIIEKTKPGSIVVFHDNYKAEEKLNYMLPRYLNHFKKRGYSFKKLDQL